MFGNAKIRTKFVLGLGIVLGIILVAIIINFYQFQKAGEATDNTVEETVRLGSMCEQVLTEIINQQTDVGGYLVSGDEKFLVLYTAGRENIDYLLKEIEPYLSRHPNIGGLISEVKPKIEAIERFYNEQVDLVKNGNIEEAKGRFDEGKALVDDYRGTHEKICADIDKLINDEWNKAKGARQQAIWTLGAIGLISLIVGIAIVSLLSNMINNPIKSLIENVKEVSNGNLIVEKIGINSQDELGELDMAFSNMTTSLRNLVEQVSNSAQQVVSSSQELSASAEEAIQASQQVSNSVNYPPLLKKWGLVTTRKCKRRKAPSLEWCYYRQVDNYPVA